MVATVTVLFGFLDVMAAFATVFRKNIMVSPCNINIVPFGFTRKIMTVFACLQCFMMAGTACF
jgi:hypothetical protein